MKIQLRGMGSRQLIRKLEKSGITDLVGGTHNELFFDATWPSDDLAEFLKAAAKFGSFDLNPWMTFTRAEIARADFLNVRPRKAIKDTNADYERMRDAMDALPWTGDDPMYRCRLPQQIFLSRITLQPNQVAVVGQWTAEFVVPQAVRSTFEAAALTGVEFRPIANTRSGSTFDDFSHLYTDQLLGKRCIDIATREIESPIPEERGFDILGCFCYDAEILETALDFNRTGEGNIGFQFPDWIVSSKVRDVFVENKLKGWAFEPVLETGTDIYDDYVQLWSSLFALLADCKKHTVQSHSV